MAFLNLSFEYSNGTGATVTSGAAEPWAISTGMQLSVSVGGTTELWAFTAGDGASAAALVAAILPQTTLVLPSDEGGFLKLTSLAPGGQAELVVLGGTANSTLLFDSLVHYGETYFGTPWSWVVDVVNAGKSVRELFTDPVDPTRELFGTAWYAVSAFEDEQIIFTDNTVPSFTERFRVYEPTWGASVVYVLPGFLEDFTQNDPAVLPSTDQMQAHEVGWTLAPTDGTFDPEIDAGLTETITNGSFAAATVDNGTEEIEKFQYVLPGKGYGVCAAVGDNTLQIGDYVYTVEETSVPPGLTALEIKAFVAKALAKAVNKDNPYYRVHTNTYFLFPEEAIFLYPLTSDATLLAEASPIELNGIGLSSVLNFQDAATLGWLWTDYFPPR